MAYRLVPELPHTRDISDFLGVCRGCAFVHTRDFDTGCRAADERGRVCVASQAIYIEDSEEAHAAYVAARLEG
jgi:hypothetical protein